MEALLVPKGVLRLWIDEPASYYSGKGREAVVEGFISIHDVDHSVALGHKIIRDEPAMAAPPEPLGAHKSGGLCGS